MGFFSDVFSGNISQAFGSDLTGGNSLVSQVGKVASNPLVDAAVAVVAPELTPYIAASNVATNVASGKPIDAGTLLNAASAASGLGVDTGIDPSTLSTARTGLAAANALQTGNVAGMVSSLAQLAGASSDVKTALNAANAVTAYQKGDVAGLLNALNNITGSVAPQVAALATQIIHTVNPGGVQLQSTADKTATKPTTDTTATDTTTTNTTSTTPATTTTASTTTNPLATPTGPVGANGQVNPNPLALPSMPTVKAPPATIGKINEIDLNKLFDQVNSLNPVQDTTINARSGGSINDLVQLLNSRG